MPARPCLDCGTLTREGSRCPTHQAQRNRIRNRHESPERKEKKAKLYNTAYQKHARAIRAGALLCHLCGGGARAGDPWEADHVEAGNINSPLLPAHRSCNQRRGNKPLNR